MGWPIISSGGGPAAGGGGPRAAVPAATPWAVMGGPTIRRGGWPSAGGGGPWASYTGSAPGTGRWWVVMPVRPRATPGLIAGAARAGRRADDPAPPAGVGWGSPTPGGR